MTGLILLLVDRWSSNPESVNHTILAKGSNFNGVVSTPGKKIRPVSASTKGEDGRDPLPSESAVEVRQEGGNALSDP